MKQSREFFTASGEPDPNQKDLADKKGEELVKNWGRDPSLEKMLSGVDFGLLKSILQEKAVRSNVDPKTMNFLGQERITHKVAKAMGEYYTEENIIGLRPDAIEQQAAYHDLNPILAVMATLCHEEIHAASRTECRGLEAPLDQYPFAKEIRMGYAGHSESKVASKEKPKEITIFKLFNEGVTEKLSREVFLEYARRTGKYSKKDLQRFKIFWGGPPEEIGYGRTVGFVEILIIKLARASGVDRKTVWHALIRGLYEGEDLMDKKLQVLFRENVSPKFLDKLAHVKNDAEMEKLSSELRKNLISIPETEPFREKVKKFFS